jgi:hypothetical protein
MIDVQSLANPQPTSKHTLYRYVEPPALSSTPGNNFKRAGEEYRGFLLIVDSDYMLWEITTLEGGLPPIPLRSRFSLASRAKAQIDTFHAEEAKKKE